MSLFTGKAAAEPKACSEAPFDTLFEKTAVSAESTRRQEARDENDPIAALWGFLDRLVRDQWTSLGSFLQESVLGGAAVMFQM